MVNVLWGGQRKRYKDSFKSTLKTCHIEHSNWEETALDRPKWRRLTKVGVASYEVERIAEAKRKLSQWNTVISLARRGKPYHVVPLKYMHVLDFKGFVQQCCPNLKTTTSGNKISWMNVCWIQTRRDYPLSLFINETLDETQFLEIKVQAATRKKGRPSTIPDSLSSCYQVKLPISVAKKADLVNLCKKIIPEECHEYYNSLSTTQNKADVIPAPASDEEEEHTDTE